MTAASIRKIQNSTRIVTQHICWAAVTSHSQHVYCLLVWRNDWFCVLSAFFDSHHCIIAIYRAWTCNINVGLFSYDKLWDEQCNALHNIQKVHTSSILCTVLVNVFYNLSESHIMSHVGSSTVLTQQPMSPRRHTRDELPLPWLPGRSSSGHIRLAGMCAWPTHFHNNSRRGRTCAFVLRPPFWPAGSISGLSASWLPGSSPCSRRWNSK